MSKRNSSPPDRAATAAAMNALSHARRILIYEKLAAEPSGLSHSGLLEETGLSISTLNHHLRPMRAAGVVATRRKGRYMMYRLNAAALSPHIARVEALSGAARP